MIDHLKYNSWTACLAQPGLSGKLESTVVVGLNGKLATFEQYMV